jgi:hypothetical protein
MKNPTERKCYVYAEICIEVMAASPKEAAGFFERKLDEAFNSFDGYDINDRIHVIDAKTDVEQHPEEELFDLEAEAV